MILNLFIGLAPHFYLELSVVSFFVACSFARIATIMLHTARGLALPPRAFDESKLLCRLRWIRPRQNFARQEPTSARGAMPDGFAPPTHWLVAFSLPFCGSATAYESQTLAAFGEKEHHTTIAVEALSLSTASASQLLTSSVLASRWALA